MKALYFNEFGTSEVLNYGDVIAPVINQDEILVKTNLIGLNFADIYRRRGDYHIEAGNPMINGYEGMGIIIDTGKNVIQFKSGDRIIFADVPFANAELVKMNWEHAIKVPDEITDETAASIGLQGLTADFLAHDLAKNNPGDQVLIQGISGGLGQLLTQILTADKIKVFGVASSVNKQKQAMNLGAEKVFIRSSDWDNDYVDKFETVYDGAGVSLNQSLKVVKIKGRVIFYGMAGGNPPKIDPIELLNQSKSIMTGDLWHYLADYESRKYRSNRLFKYVKAGEIIVKSPKIFSLADGKAAYDFLESGKSAGKVLLRP